MRWAPLLLLPFLVACEDVSPPDLSLAPDDDDDSTEDAALLCPDGLTAAPEEGAYVAQDALPVTAQRADCTSPVHPTAGAAGSTLRVELSSWGGAGTVTLRVSDLLGNQVASAGGLSANEGLDVPLDRSGEWLVTVSPDDPQEPGADYGLRASCVDGCNGRYTRYPIVLVHGMAGTDSYLGGYDYWWQVLPDLTADGYLAFTPAVDALAPPPSRAEQWSAILDQLILDGQGRRFNLIAHSQGGIDSRYLATVLGRGDVIASITTVATPHYGSGLADVAHGVIQVAPGTAELVEDGLSALSDALGLGPSQLLLATEAMTRPAMDAFNAAVPDHPDVRYFSWAGRTCGFVEFGCQDAMDGETVAPYLIATYRALQLLDGDNDGIVPTESSRWGEDLGTLGADHFDEIGQLVGLTDGGFDHRGFYLAEAFRLRQADL